ncbi:unnamed protein product [Ixodes pacificus]
MKTFAVGHTLLQEQRAIHCTHTSRATGTRRCGRQCSHRSAATLRRHTANGQSPIKARQKYEATRQVQVFTCGLIVSPSNPWLGCSPDGVLFDGGRPAKLLEIKCPTKGQTMSAKALLATCDFLQKDDAGIYMLKVHHTHYAQVQLGMALLDVRTCDLVVYADFDNSIEILSVGLDEAFLWSLLTKVKNVYFERILLVLCSC